MFLIILKIPQYHYFSSNYDLLVKFDSGLMSSRYYCPVISIVLKGVDFTSYLHAQPQVLIGLN